MNLVNIISILNAAIFVIIATFHFYWLLGGKWGLNNTLPQFQNSTKPIKIPSSFLTFIVACIFFSIGLFYLSILLLNLNHILTNFVKIIIILLSLVLLLRSIGEFKYIGLFKKIKNTDFAKKDTQYYTPLCMYLSLSTIYIYLNV